MFLFDTCFISACFGLQNVTQTRDKYLCMSTVGKRFKIVFARKPNIAQMVDVTGRVVKLRAHLVAPSASQNCPL